MLLLLFLQQGCSQYASRLCILHLRGLQVKQQQQQQQAAALHLKPAPQQQQLRNPAAAVPAALQM
jgi:hypothetical protein